MQNQRQLPWRQTQDPYAIWISEIMLQQTQVATVLPYYFRFLERFPSLHALAKADESELMRYWEGLGYYRRARQIHMAAKQIVAQNDGEFPRRFEDVLDLPGIGRYTAGAICSFAYDARTPIVEANTQRLYARLLGWEKPLDIRESNEALWGFAEAILPKSKGTRTINYAAMELGALVCKPKPDCKCCPLLTLCPTARDGLQEKIPAPKTKMVYSNRFEIALLVKKETTLSGKVDRERNAYLVRQCGADEWWTGLWDFPRIEVDRTLFEAIDRPLINSRSNSSTTDIEDQFAMKFGFRTRFHTTPIATIKHSVTRYRIQLRVFVSDCYDLKSIEFGSMDTATNNANAPEGFQWASLAQLKAMPLSASARKIYKLIAMT